MRRIKLIGAALLLLCLCACGNTEDGSWNGMEEPRSLELQYAKEFRVDYYEDGYDVDYHRRGRISPGARGNAGARRDRQRKVTVLQQPLENLYVASSSAMDLFFAGQGHRPGGHDQHQGPRRTEPAPRDPGEGNFRRHPLCGESSTPDYEVVLDEGCGLAVENTMISHTPEVKEKLEQLGIPVLVERSSYEKSPLGRVE